MAGGPEFIVPHVSMFWNNLQMFLNNLIFASSYLRSKAKFQNSAPQFFILDLNYRFTKFQLSTIFRSWVLNV